MAYAFPGANALDYAPCPYGASRLIFRGPACDLTRPYAACLGGSETYGRFIADPWPRLLGRGLGIAVANLGCMNAGPDVYLQDKPTLQIAAQATVTVVQITGAQNLSNRFYSVHPRRNDRLIGVTPLLRSIFRRVDFTEFNFTRHLLFALNRHNPDAFDVVAEELRAAWVNRMQALLRQLKGPSLLLWVADAPPPAPGPEGGLSVEPMLIDREMITSIRPLASVYLEFCPSLAARAKGHEGKFSMQGGRIVFPVQQITSG